MNATHLLQLALSGIAPHGPNKCVFCGNACAGLNDAAKYIRDTFTDFDSIACPSSKFVCDGCVLAMREKIDMPGRDKPQKSRTYSWFITPTIAEPLTKADIARMRAICVDPPAPPFALCIAVSGQKHLLFKTPAAVDPARVIVTLEGEIIDFAPADIRDRLAMIYPIVAACGKPCLTEPPTWKMAMRLHESGVAEWESMFDHWSKIWREPLSKLAAFLTPSMKEIQS
jgi:hypothetical protein